MKTLEMKAMAWRKTTIVLTVSICAALVATSVQAGESCGGCETMKAVAEKLRTVSIADEQKVNELLDAATKAILSLPRAKGQRLSQAQVGELAALLSQVTKVDNIHLVLQDTVEVIKVHQADLKKALRQLPPEDAKRVSLYVAAVLEEQKSGNDEPASGKK